MDKQTFTDNMKACGYEPSFGDNTVRLVPLADHGVYIGTLAITRRTRRRQSTA